MLTASNLNPNFVNEFLRFGAVVARDLLGSSRLERHVVTVITFDWQLSLLPCDHLREMASFSVYVHRGQLCFLMQGTLMISPNFITEGDYKEDHRFRKASHLHRYVQYSPTSTIHAFLVS